MSEIILGTGNYNSVKSGNRLSISGDGGEKAKYIGNAYKKLAPRWVTYITYKEKLDELETLSKNPYRIKEYLEKRKIIEDEYIKSFYETRLKDLDVKELLYYLKETFGEELIMLCYEEVNEFCHRRLVADYIEDETGIFIPEVKVDETGKVKQLSPIRYTDRLKKLM
jgi:uncharacterized protein (DUF488 family)